MNKALAIALALLASLFLWSLLGAAPWEHQRERVLLCQDALKVRAQVRARDPSRVQPVQPMLDAERTVRRWCE